MTIRRHDDGKGKEQSHEVYIEDTGHCPDYVFAWCVTGYGASPEAAMRNANNALDRIRNTPACDPFHHERQHPN